MIVRIESEMCFVKYLEMFFKWCGFLLNCFDFIFCNMSKIKLGYKVWNGNKVLIYMRMRELFIEVFKCFVFDILKYGLYSLRVGGVIVCVNFGIFDRLFKRYGRWVFEFVKDGYIKDKLEFRLLVFLNLGL